MKISADHSGNPRYFTAKLGWKEHFDSREIDMLMAEAVPMLIPPLVVQGKHNHVIRYDISLYSTLEYYLTGILSREQFADILLQCIDILKKMQQVYLNYKNLVFDLDKVYILLSDKTVHLIYLPLSNSSRDASIPQFFKSILQKTTRSTYEQAAFLDECKTWLSQSTPFTLEEFENFVQTKGKGQPHPVPQTPPSAAEQPDDSVIFAPTFYPDDTEIVKSPHTTPLASPARHDGETIILNQPLIPITHYYLLRTQTGEKVEIKSFPFSVGRVPESVAYCIIGNGAISSKHAEFTFQDGHCLITDQGSTNKTYVNGQLLLPYVSHLLENGDQIQLANEQFTFILEETGEWSI